MNAARLPIPGAEVVANCDHLALHASTRSQLQTLGIGYVPRRKSLYKLI